MSVFGQKKCVLISSSRCAGLSLPLWEESSFLLTASFVYMWPESNLVSEYFIKLAARKPTRLVLPDEGGNDHLIL